MQILELEQGTQEWLDARLGLVTASNAGKVITSQGKKPSAFDGFVNTLIAERLMGEPTSDFTTPWMERGKELEEEARDWYELTSENTVQQVGFCKAVDMGCSPDGLVGSDGGLEIKCPKPETHIDYLRKDKMPAAYVPQVQFCMMITERDWWDFVSYHPLMPKLLVRVERDDKFIKTMADLTMEALQKRDSIIDQIRSKAA